MEKVSREKIEKEILSIIQEKMGGTVDNLAMINEELKNRYNGFDLKDYGYSRVSGFLRSIKGLSVDGNVVRIEKITRDYEIKAGVGICMLRCMH